MKMRHHGTKRVAALFLAGIMLAVQVPGLNATAESPKNTDAAFTESREMKQNKNTKVVSTTYYDPQKGTDNWREAMVSGNGENGVLESGVPGNDTFIFQNTKFNMPIDDLRETQDLYTELETARQKVMENGEFYSSVQQEMAFDYSFHPGHQLRVKRNHAGENFEEYQRYTDYNTAEIGVEYTDADGLWKSRTFTSRKDNVTITYYEKSSKGRKLDLTVSIDDLSDMSLDDHSGEIDSRLRYKKIVEEAGSYIGLAGHYPELENSELNKGGYAGVTYILNIGGTKEKKELGDITDRLYAGQDKTNYGVHVKDADAVVLITKSDRDVDMGTYDAFSEEESWELVDHLITDVQKAAEKYRDKEDFDYDAALSAHEELHGKEFGKVKFDLAGNAADESLTNEELIEKQRNDSGTLNQSMAERAFYAGRYAQICASGYSTSRLGGIWTGAWNPRWQGDYTTDANVNLQISGVNIGNMKEASRGYISFILRIADDFEENAAKVYGMKDAIMAPPRTDGDRGSIVHFNNEYPFNYWNAGAAWLLLPIYEYWQCYGNEEIPIGDDVDLQSLKSVLSVTEEDLSDAKIQKMEKKGTLNLEQEILLPLLIKQVNFWKQLTTPQYYTDAGGYKQYDKSKTALEEGEKYLLLPGYSPENKPGNTWCAISANVSMDIAAARSSLDMLIDLYEKEGKETEAEELRAFKNDLPEYQYDEDGALKEWALKDYKEQNNHRHVSHMYPVWPEHEAEQDDNLMQGAKKALENRKQYNTGDDNASHGWLHQALTEARMKKGNTVEEILCGLMSSSRLFFSSMMTNHDKWRTSAYCTDASITMPAIMLEALAYSDTGMIEILPALPGGWKEGSISGMMARSQTKIKNLSWNKEKNTASVVIRPDADQTLELKCGEAWDKAVITTGQRAEVKPGESLTISLKAGEELGVTFHLPSPQEGEKLSGTLFARTTGQWESQTPASNAFDGDTATFYDGEEGSWIGMELEEAVPLTGVRIVARGDDFEGRLAGVQIQGSQDGKAWDTLYTMKEEDIIANPSYMDICPLEAGKGQAYRYYRLYGADEHFVNVAELEFWGDVSASPRMALKLYINELEHTDYGLYTADSRAALEAALQTAKTAAEDESLTTEQLTQAKETLSNIVKSMVREWIITTDKEMICVGSWKEYKDGELKSGLELYTEEIGAYVEFQFDGTGIQMYSNKNPGLSFADIYIDGELVKDKVSLFQSTDPGSKNQLIAEISGLPYKVHTAKVVLSEEKNENGKAKLSVDAFKILWETSQRSYTVRAKAADAKMGRVTISPESEDSLYTEGTEISVKAIPSEGYRFVQWTEESGADVSTEEEYTFKAAKDISLSAEFEKVPVKPEEPPVKPEKVIFEKETEQIILREEKQLHVTVTPEHAEGADQITWKSSDEEILSVDEKGMIKAMWPGEATVTARAGDVSGTLKVTVEGVEKVYPDVSIDDWYYEPVNWAYVNHVMSGYHDGTFGAPDKLSRAQFAMILYRIAGEPGTEAVSRFQDVEKGDWYYDAVVWANENRIITGYADGKTFGAADDITREQLATILYRYAKEQGQDIEVDGKILSFPDEALVSEFAKDAMEWAVGAGLISGNLDGTLAPQGETSRAVCAAIIMRFMENNK